jgi:hypothetical protein
MSIVFIELRLILVFFSCEDDGLFHCDDYCFVSGLYLLFHRSIHDVIADYYMHMITKTPTLQLLMLTQRCLLAHCLIKIECYYSCKCNTMLPSVDVL